MKSIDFLCASPASTAICSSTDQRAMVRSHGTRSMDRRSNHYISDHYRRKSKNNTPAIPCSPQLPDNPTSYYRKSRKSAIDYSSTYASQSNRELRRKNSAEIINDLTVTPHGSSRHLLSDKTFSEVLPHTDSSLALVPSGPIMPRSLSSKEPVIPRSLSFNDSALVSTNPALRPGGQPISSDDTVNLKSINKQLVDSQTAESPRYQVLQCPFNLIDILIY